MKILKHGEIPSKGWKAFDAVMEPILAEFGEIVLSKTITHFWAVELDRPIKSLCDGAPITRCVFVGTPANFAAWRKSKET